MLRLETRSNVLVMEEQGIIAYDIQKQLEKHGYTVMNQKAMDLLAEIVSERMPEIIIASVGLIRKMNNGRFNIVYCNDFHKYQNSDTIVIDISSGYSRRFPKPFNTFDIVEFVGAYLNGCVDKEEKNIYNDFLASA